MPLWTAETQNPLYCSRIVPMLMGAALGNLPITTEVDRHLLFQLSLGGVTRRLEGRWMLLAWRSYPDTGGATAEVSLDVDGIILIADDSLTNGEYVIGPSKIRNDPSSSPVNRYIISHEYMELSGRVITGLTFDTEYLAVRLDYT